MLDWLIFKEKEKKTWYPISLRSDFPQNKSAIEQNFEHSQTKLDDPPMFWTIKIICKRYINTHIQSHALKVYVPFLFSCKLIPQCEVFLLLWRCSVLISVLRHHSHAVSLKKYPAAPHRPVRCDLIFSETAPTQLVIQLQWLLLLLSTVTQQNSSKWCFKRLLRHLINLSLTVVTCVYEKHLRTTAV